MSAFQALKGTVIDGVWVDVPGHRVIVTLRATTEPGPVGHTLVLEGVTDFSFFDEDPGTWAHAEVTGITTEHDPGVMRVDVSFASESAGITMTCAKAVLHRNPRGK